MSQILRVITKLNKNVMFSSHLIKEIPKHVRLLSNISDCVSITEHGIKDGEKELLHLETRMMCRCEKCFGRYTHQKQPNFDIKTTVRVTDILAVSDEYITSQWSDGHSGFIPRDIKAAHGTLIDPYALQLTQRRNQVQQFWSSPNSDILKSFRYEDVIKKDENLRNFLMHFMKYGVGFISGAPSNSDLTKLINEDIKCGPIVETIFGTLDKVSFRHEGYHHAYNASFIPGHTDLPYMTSTPSLFFFFCEENTTANTTFYVDTFAALDEIRRTKPDLFEMLCTTNIYFKYAPPATNMYLSGTHKLVEMRGDEIFKVVDQVSVLDEAEFVKNTDISTRTKWWEAYLFYKSLTTDPNRAISKHIRPGDVILADNWRVLHGRDSFETDSSTERVVHTAYLDWAHAQRTLLAKPQLDTFLDLPNI